MGGTAMTMRDGETLSWESWPDHLVFHAHAQIWATYCVLLMGALRTRPEPRSRLFLYLGRV
jgi:hypothetical protein